MLPAIRLVPNNSPNMSFQVFENKDEKGQFAPINSVGGSEKRQREKENGLWVGQLDSRLSESFRTPLSPRKSNLGFLTPPPTFSSGKKGKRRSDDRLQSMSNAPGSPAKLHARSPLLDVGFANSPGHHRKSLTPSACGFEKRASSGSFSAARSQKSRAPRGARDRSYHGCGRSPRHHGNKSLTQFSLCRSLFSSQKPESPTVEKLEQRNLEEIAVESPRKCAVPKEPVFSFIPSPPKLVSDEAQPSSKEAEVLPDAQFPGVDRHPVRGNKALLNEAFIESISRVFSPDDVDDTLAIDSSSAKRISGASSGTKGVLTSSPKCIVKCATPTESAACSPGDGSSHSVIAITWIMRYQSFIIWAHSLHEYLSCL